MRGTGVSVGLAVVRSLDAPRSLTSVEKQEDSGQELADQFLLAVVGAGMGDATVNPARAMVVVDPPAVGLAALREALDSPSPVRAVITALLAYHAIPMRQLSNLQLTDIRGGRRFIHARSWKATRPFTSYWIGRQLAISAEHIRLDRIYQEVEATRGDFRAECDRVGMSIANAARWATTVGHSSEPAVTGGNREHDPPGTR